MIELEYIKGQRDGNMIAAYLKRDTPEATVASLGNAIKGATEIQVRENASLEHETYMNGFIQALLVAHETQSQKL